MGMELRIR